MIIDTLASSQWWKEHDFVFEGTPSTKYYWPRDRLILMTDGFTSDGIQNSIIVPTFNLKTAGGEIEDQIAAGIQYFYDNNYILKSTTRDEFDSVQVFPKTAHMHLFSVDGMPSEYGILTHTSKMSPVVDCWADSEARKERTLNRRRK